MKMNKKRKEKEKKSDSGTEKYYLEHMYIDRHLKQ